MKARSFLVIAITIAAAGGTALGYWAGREDGARTGAAAGRTVTVAMTVTGRDAPADAGPSRRAGRRVFAANCAECHTFQPGDWTGRRVNLTALRPDYSTVVTKVTRGGIAMPSFAGRLSERQIRDVAAFVAVQAARGGAR
jgi:mono/diheme cytochrome c family protein